MRNFSNIIITCHFILILNKNRINDKLLSVNGVNVENVEHSFVIRLLKEAKDFIHLVIKRNINNNQKSINELNEITKRRNQAITKTAATVISNYTNSVNNSNNNLENPLSLIMNKSNFVSSLKPIKVTLNKKDKKDSFGVVLGCQFYIKDILPNSSAASEANLCRGDILVKLNDLTSEQLTLNEANKILSKSKETKLNLIVKRNAGSGSSGISSLSNSDSDDLIDENPIQLLDQVDNNKSSTTTTAQQHRLNNFNNTISTPIIQQAPIAEPNFKPIVESNENNRLSKFYSK